MSKCLERVKNRRLLHQQSIKHLAEASRPLHSALFSVLLHACPSPRVPCRADLLGSGFSLLLHYILPEGRDSFHSACWPDTAQGAWHVGDSGSAGDFSVAKQLRTWEPPDVNWEGCSSHLRAVQPSRCHPISLKIPRLV